MRRIIPFIVVLILICIGVAGAGAFIIVQNGGLAPGLTTRASPGVRNATAIVVQLTPPPPGPTPAAPLDLPESSDPSLPQDKALGKVPQGTEVPPPAPTEEPLRPPVEGTPRPPIKASPQHTPTPAAVVPVGPTPTPLYAANLPADVVNVLLVGVDLRVEGTPWRTDTLIIVSIDRWNRTVSLLSIPRDLWVYIPDFGYSRINTADFWGSTRKLEGGGIATLERTIEYNLGIPVHRYARVDFKGFTQIVDTLGGLDLTVDCPIKDPLTGWKIDAGPQHMDGETALRYARSRYSTSDFDRARRQQQVLQAIFDKALSLGLITQLPHLWTTLTDAVKTDLSLVEMLTLAYFGTRVQPQNIRSQVIGWPVVRSWTSPHGEAVLLLDQVKFTEMLATLHQPPAEDPVTPPEQASVEVLNGTRQDRLAELAAGNLKRKGFDVIATGPADRTDYRSSAIILANPDKIKTATRLAETLGIDPQYVTVFHDPTSPADIRVIVGVNYQPCQR
jgi:LCP family protein required for cell wall assembly